MEIMTPSREPTPTRAPYSSALLRLLCSGALQRWQREVEAGALARLALDPDVAAVALDDALRDVEAEPAALGPLRLPGAIEDAKSGLQRKDAETRRRKKTKTGGLYLCTAAPPRLRVESALLSRWRNVAAVADGPERDRTTSRSAAAAPTSTAQTLRWRPAGSLGGRKNRGGFPLRIFDDIFPAGTSSGARSTAQEARRPGRAKLRRRKARVGRRRSGKALRKSPDRRRRVAAHRANRPSVAAENFPLPPPCARWPSPLILRPCLSP